jgi:hypothetical protein
MYLVKFFNHFICYTLLFCVTFYSIVSAQSRGDFYDAYDYDLRRYNPSVDLEKFEEYKLPPEYEKNPSITPKYVQPPTNPFGFLPTDSIVNPSTGIGALGQRRTSNRINPVTGEIETQSVYNQQREERDKKPQKKVIPPYTETPERRTQIIFFLTFPFAAGLMAGITYFAGGIAKTNYLNTAPGAFFIFGGASALSFWNVSLDKKNVANHEKEPVALENLFYMEPYKLRGDHLFSLFQFSKQF